MSTVPITEVAEDTSRGERDSTGINAARAGWLAVEMMLNTAARARIATIERPSSTDQATAASSRARRALVTSSTLCRG